MFCVLVFHPTELGCNFQFVAFVRIYADHDMSLLFQWCVVVVQRSVRPAAITTCILIYSLPLLWIAWSSNLSLEMSGSRAGALSAMDAKENSLWLLSDIDTYVQCEVCNSWVFRAVLYILEQFHFTISRLWRNRILWIPNRHCNVGYWVWDRDCRKGGP